MDYLQFNPKAIQVPIDQQMHVNYQLWCIYKLQYFFWSRLVTSAYEYRAWCHIMWYHVIRTIYKPVYSSIIVQLYMYIQECASDLDVDYVLLWGLIVKGCSTFWSSCSDMEGFESFQVKYT